MAPSHCSTHRHHCFWIQRKYWSHLGWCMSSTPEMMLLSFGRSIEHYMYHCSFVRLQYRWHTPHVPSLPCIAVLHASMLPELTLWAPMPHRLSFVHTLLHQVYVCLKSKLRCHSLCMFHSRTTWSLEVLQSPRHTLPARRQQVHFPVFSPLIPLTSHLYRALRVHHWARVSRPCSSWQFCLYSLYVQYVGFYQSSANSLQMTELGMSQIAPSFNPLRLNHKFLSSCE